MSASVVVVAAREEEAVALPLAVTLSVFLFPTPPLCSGHLFRGGEATQEEEKEEGGSFGDGESKKESSVVVP